MKKTLCLLFLLFTNLAWSITNSDSLVTHKTEKDKNGKILSWYKPETPGAGYDKVINLAAGFIKNECPVEPTTGLPLYYVHTWFLSPREAGWEKFKAGVTGSDDGHTPACTFANFVKSFALGYYPYSGDSSYVELAAHCLDYILEHGTTPGDWTWGNCPYASANPRSTEYFGATPWGFGGRNDGPYVIEPDKVAELGLEYLNFYKITLNEKYLTAAMNCADALAKNTRKGFDWREDNYNKPLTSPWPFRVYAQNGQVLEEYTAHVICGIQLFDDLLKLPQSAQFDTTQQNAWTHARKTVWDWLYSTEGPMRTFVWKGYFEDIPNDPYNKNRVQNIPMETARYLIKYPNLDANMETRVPALIYWVASAFEINEMDGIREQFWCYAGMGSHAARYASICALWYERTGQPWFKEQAFRFFNWATYMCDKNGHVIVGPDFVPQYWFSDGYGDYVRHFLEGIAAIPEWAPADENHLLRSSSVIQYIKYSPADIRYCTFDKGAVEVFRLTFKPSHIFADGIKLSKRDNLNSAGWTWQGLEKGGIVRIFHTNSCHISIHR